MVPLLSPRTGRSHGSPFFFRRSFALADRIHGVHALATIEVAKRGALRGALDQGLLGWFAHLAIKTRAARGRCSAADMVWIALRVGEKGANLTILVTSRLEAPPRRSGRGSPTTRLASTTRCGRS